MYSINNITKKSLRYSNKISFWSLKVNLKKEKCYILINMDFVNMFKEQENWIKKIVLETVLYKLQKSLINVGKI